MKIRMGFVSNSSSSSFVVSLRMVTEGARKELIDIVERHNNDSGEGNLTVGKNFIYGDIDQCCGQELANYVKKNFNSNDWECG